MWTLVILMTGLYANSHSVHGFLKETACETARVSIEKAWRSKSWDAAPVTVCVRRSGRE